MIKKFLLKLPRALLVLSLAASAMNVLPTRGFLQDLNRDFGPYYLGLHVLGLIAVIAFWRRLSRFTRVIFPAALLFCIGYYTTRLWPFYFAPPAAEAHGPSFTILYAKIDRPLTDLAALGRLITEKSPDLLALVSVDRAAVEELKLRPLFPYAHEIIRDDDFGLGLYSRFRIAEPATDNFGTDLPPVIMAEILPPGQPPFHFIVLHAEAPVSNDTWMDNFMLHRRLTTRLKHSHDAVILAGCMNTTPFSATYEGLRFYGKLKNAMYGFGYQRTWKAGNPLLRLALDHVLYRGQLAVLDFRRWPGIGSRHLPLTVTFAPRG